MAIQTIYSRGSRCKRTASRFFPNTIISRDAAARWHSIWSNDQDELTTVITPPLQSSSSLLPMTMLSYSPASNNYCHHRHNRRFMSSQPFYETPLPPSTRYNSSQDMNQDIQQQNHYLPPLTPLQRLATLVHSSLTALNDPTRGDAVAAVGEVTGQYALSKMMAGMESNEVGRRILKEQPIVNYENVARRAMKLLQQHEQDEMMSGTTNNTINVTHNHPINGGGRGNKGISFGAAYAKFLQTHEFNPNERSPVRFISDPNLSYVMTRYRQCHDYWHVLTGLPPTVLGELALKWLELMQTGLPLAALSATGGALGASGLSDREREILWEVYFPWAVRVGSTMKAHSLMCVYYEEELETDLNVLRERMGIEVAPIL
eukprot:CAMPEP_0172308338 /NCGR_PEP_ID=MMETSP1058-20130122/8960_1 /TAXON_ID=83371 /ORGANISM="Detonula confervacea, Strain CCMP 353" /LENGTH=373 /DNA_ID=CAMNT_0013020723 /DNA_START=108 /DNA_END=1229 /DNA_ORIENTATION=+